MFLKRIKTFSFKIGEEFITFWVPTKVSELIYWIRYWIGYFILPSFYKRAVDAFNKVGWEELKKMDEEMQDLVKRKKHLKVVKREDS